MNGRRPAASAEGVEPDYRSSLANERTLLAWVRTALALVAAAVAVLQLLPPFGVAGAREVLGVLFAAAGVGTAATAYGRYAAVQRAMRRGEPLPAGWGPVVLPVFVGVVGVLVLGLALLHGGAR